MQYGRQYEFGNKLKIEIGDARFEILEQLKNMSSKSLNFDFKELLQRFE
jgi:hypothetical protein